MIDLNHTMGLLNFIAGIDENTQTGLCDLGLSMDFTHGVLSSCAGWLQSVARRILSNGCRVVGFSVYYSNSRICLAFAKILKELDSEVKIVFGGPDCLTFPTCLDYVQGGVADAVVFGEGDISFPRLIDGFAAVGRLRAGPGVLLKGEESTWREDQETLEKLDDLPYADYAGFPGLRSYAGKMIHTARGCIRKCVFCRDWREMRFRRMSGRRIFDEMAHQLGEHPDMNRFVFGDSILNSSMPDILGFCNLARAHGLDAAWEGYAIVRPDMTPQALETMRRAGCRRLWYGIESGSGRLLRDMDKGVPPALNAEVLRRTARAGVKTLATWMVGFPSETEELFEESLAFLKANAQNIGHLAVSIFSIREMQNVCGRFDLDPGQDQMFWRTRDGKNTFPLRLERARRTLEIAAEAGITTALCWEVPLSRWDAYAAQALGYYESWMASRRNSAAESNAASAGRA